MSGASLTEAENLIQLYRAAEFGRRFERILLGYQEIESVESPVGTNEPQAQRSQSDDTVAAGQLLGQFRTATIGERVSQLVGEYSNLQEKTQKRALGFNIFEVLRVHEREVKTHSAFIKELLDPYGSHEQEFRFLQAFLSQCQSLEQVIGDPEEEENGLIRESFPDIIGEKLAAYDWLVSREYPATGHDRLDILIRCEALGFLCVIENKVFARECMDQLRSYWSWMNEPKRQEAFPLRALIFLTPCGRKSEFPDGVAYFPMSYQKYIDGWLTAALENIDSPSMKAIVQQYQATIDLITAECDDE